MEDTWHKITPQKENPGNNLIHSRRKKNERTPRATHCTVRAQSSTTVSGRPSSVDLLTVCANGARSKRYERKRCQKLTNISMHICQPLEGTFPRLPLAEVGYGARSVAGGSEGCCVGWAWHGCSVAGDRLALGSSRCSKATGTPKQT